jgi:hypothetical protein
VGWQARQAAAYADLTADVSLTNCTMQGCTASGDGGGALYVTKTARVRLDSCNITNSSSVHFGGGAMIVLENSSVHMQKCRLQQNSGGTRGGAVAVAGTGHLEAVDCAFIGNACADAGGGLAIDGNTYVQLTRCLVSGCTAYKAGGMCLTDQAVVSLVDTVITKNTAAFYGGGVLLASEGFELSQIRAAVHDNKAQVQADVSVWPTHLTNLNSSIVWDYVSRLRVDEAVFNVNLLVTGPHGLPAAGVEVTAVLEGVVLHKAISGDDGLVRLHVKLLKPPGMLKLDT